MSAESACFTEEIQEALTVIRNGGIVAFPTETYYGLAVDPFNESAVSRLFALKKRPQAKPLLTLISDVRQLELLTPEIPSLYKPLINLWPCPLTLVFKARSTISELVTGKSGTVAARISSHPLAQKFVTLANTPLTATSANISGRQPSVSASDVEMSFGTSIDYVLDGGRTRGGKGSTLVGIDAGQLVLVRPGVICFDEIIKTVSTIRV